LRTKERETRKETVEEKEKGKLRKSSEKVERERIESKRRR
jgi:hypothetical protein